MAFASRLPGWRNLKSRNQERSDLVSTPATDSPRVEWSPGREICSPKTRCTRCWRERARHPASTTRNVGQLILAPPIKCSHESWWGMSRRWRVLGGRRHPSTATWEPNHRPKQPSTWSCCHHGNETPTSRLGPKEPRSYHSACWGWDAERTSSCPKKSSFVQIQWAAIKSTGKSCDARPHFGEWDDALSCIDTASSGASASRWTRVNTKLQQIIYKLKKIGGRSDLPLRSNKGFLLHSSI